MQVNRALFMKVTKDFWNWELLPPELFVIGNVNPNWYLSEFLLTFPQALRDFLGKSIVVNDWADGGGLINRGARMPDCAIGGKLSMHKFLKAVDVNVKGLTQPDVLGVVLKNRDKFQMVTAYEDLSFTHGWNHFDGRNTGIRELLMVRP